MKLSSRRWLIQVLPLRAALTDRPLTLLPMGKALLMSTPVKLQRDVRKLLPETSRPFLAIPYRRKIQLKPLTI